MEYTGLNALVPDQQPLYVHAVSGVKAAMLNGFPFYLDEGRGVLAAFGGSGEDANAAVDLALARPGLKELTVLAPFMPAEAPASATVLRDNHWVLDLPATPNQKIRNLLKRAGRETRLEQASGKSAFTEKHKELCRIFGARKKEALDEASRFIFTKIDAYLEACRNARLFSAWRGDELAAFAVADFTPLEYPFYMFAFRQDNAPPGTADLLLSSIIAEALAAGYERIHLGLGINPGVEFFKKKWGARILFPHIETTWALPPGKGFFARLGHKLFGKK